MEPDPILQEIRQHRDDLAKETGYDLQRLFAYVRERERASAARGRKFVSLEAVAPNELQDVVREEPPAS
jgi:hypothetical protein